MENNYFMEVKAMTREEIIDALSTAARPGERYYLAPEVIQAINVYPNPGEFVEPILEIIGNNPTVDFGMPGDLVRFVEMFSNRGYEELLIQSVAKAPTPHNIWMVHRCYNDPNDNRHDIYKQLIELLKAVDTTPEEVKQEIDNFDWE